MSDSQNTTQKLHSITNSTLLRNIMYILIVLYCNHKSTLFKKDSKLNHTFLYRLVPTLRFSPTTITQPDLPVHEHKKELHFAEN